VVIHPQHLDHLWVAQFSRVHTNGALVSSGILESLDGGVTWANRLPGLPTDLTNMPGSGTTFLAGMLRVDRDREGEVPGLYRSTDGGRTWTPKITFGGYETWPRIGVTPAAPQRALDVLLAGHAAGDRDGFRGDGGRADRRGDARARGVRARARAPASARRAALGRAPPKPRAKSRGRVSSNAARARSATTRAVARRFEPRRC
jgi:hypothetical protein